MGSRLKFFFAELIIVVAVLKRIVGDANSNSLAPTKVGGRNAARESILVIFFLELERGKHAPNVFSWKFLLAPRLRPTSFPGSLFSRGWEEERPWERGWAPSVRRDRRTERTEREFPKSFPQFSEKSLKNCSKQVKLCSKNCGYSPHFPLMAN